jgi:DNA processing protein
VPPPADHVSAALLAILQLQHGLLADAQLPAAIEAIADLQQRGVQLLTPQDGRYPANLANTPNPPPLLFVDGELTDADRHAVAVIGSRNATSGGLATTTEIAQRLAAAGRPVVSGLARGVDTAAHKAAITANARTVAVIGTGIDLSYPPENEPLQHQIASTGAVISQFLPGAGPSRDTFPERNATMAAFTAATVIVEASYKSGVRIQARQALTIGRPVILLKSLLTQDWAQTLARAPGVRVIAKPEELLDAIG